MRYVTTIISCGEQDSSQNSNPKGQEVDRKGRFGAFSEASERPFSATLVMNGSHFASPFY
jgi:hypothetical protein